MSASASHHGLFDRVVLKEVRLRDGLVVRDSEHRRRVAALCMFHKIHCNVNHALETVLPRVHVPARLTLLDASVHSW